MEHTDKIANNLLYRIMASKSLSDSVQPLSFQVLNTTEAQFCNEEITVRLIHFWEARNFTKGNILMGVELLLIDSGSNAVQGFISANRLHRFEDDLKANTIYKLKRFMVNPSRSLYKVTDHAKTICFTEQTKMDKVAVSEGDYNLPTQKFRVQNFADFVAIADTNTHLFDVIGQLRLISGDNLQSPKTFETAAESFGNRSKDRVFLHLLMKDGETIRVYLWGNIAAKFRERWNNGESQPSVLLITTVNPKTIGGAVTLSSTSSTRLFFDSEIDETKEFMAWLGTNKDIMPAVSSSSSAITKLETVTLSEIKQYLQSESPQVVSFYCLATIVDVLQERGWYYISCKCKTKLGKSETSLYCPKCQKTNNIGLIRYRFEIMVRDKDNEEATFVIFDRDGVKLAGRDAADVLNETKQTGKGEAERINTEFPTFLKKIIGRSCKFQIQIKPYNFMAARQTFTVSRIIDNNIESIESQNLEGNETSKGDNIILHEIIDKKNGKRPRIEK